MWLLVEDDSDIRTVVAMMMTVWGENPLPFPDGKSAWAWLDSVESGSFSGPLPDLALMDIRMPGYTGDQLAARMRSIDRLKDIPIILMTAFSLSEVEITALRERCGIDHLLEKPLPDLEVFRTLLYRVRDERRDTQNRAPVTPMIEGQKQPDSTPSPDSLKSEVQPLAGQDAAPKTAPDAPAQEPSDTPSQPGVETPPQTGS